MANLLSTDDIDARVRQAAFDLLTGQMQLSDGILSRSLLERGFEFQGVRVPLVGPPGIFKPAILPDIPLSITTVPAVEGKRQPYPDAFESNGLFRYSYRGTNRNHPDNVGLRNAMVRRTPLVHFIGVVPGKYLPRHPVYIVNDHPDSLCFLVDWVEASLGLSESGFQSEVSESRRVYVAVTTRHRVHQAAFREQVLRAYRQCCAVCRLRHDELLEAAHILPDGHPKGEPVVPNGLALCKLHHAAFDANILGIRPDLIVELREDVLREIDGPMLKHGLQGFQGSRILVPNREILKPKPEFLEERFELFKKAV